jgi:hypothetical protein
MILAAEQDDIQRAACPEPTITSFPRSVVIHSIEMSRFAKLLLSILRDLE